MPHSLVRFCRTNHFCADVHPSAVAPGETPHAINNAGADGLDVTSRFTSVDGSLSALNACVQMCASKEKNGFLFPLRHGPIEIASSRRIIIYLLSFRRVLPFNAASFVSIFTGQRVPRILLGEDERRSRAPFVDFPVEVKKKGPEAYASGSEGRRSAGRKQNAAMLL